MRDDERDTRGRSRRSCLSRPHPWMKPSRCRLVCRAKSARSRGQAYYQSALERSIAYFAQKIDGGAVCVFCLFPSYSDLRCSASGVNSDGSLNVCFKIAGLGNNQSIDVTASAHADAVYVCRNNRQQCPNAANKVEVKANVSASGQFTSGKNGQITACLTVDPPPTELTCPPGQKLVLVSVTYSNVTITAPGAGECDPAPGTFSANFVPNCP
jgi:hypothetical protein